jgi:hypothetical protein
LNTGTEPQLFNTIRNKRVFKKEWKIALIQPIYKGKGDRKELGNYRGISLLPVLGKIYSRLLAYRLRLINVVQQTDYVSGGFYKRKENSR